MPISSAARPARSQRRAGGNVSGGDVSGAAGVAESVTGGWAALIAVTAGA
ncbi:hypothetical protein [Nocardia brasiliensis]